MSRGGGSDLLRAHDPGFRAAVADLLGLHGTPGLLTRRDAALALAPRLRTTAASLASATTDGRG